MSSRVISRVVSDIDRNCYPADILEAVGFKVFDSQGVLPTITYGVGPSSVTLNYFKPDRMIRNAVHLALEFEVRNLMPDPLAQIVDNQQNPEFVKRCRNVTQWGLVGDISSYMVFMTKPHGLRVVICKRQKTSWPSGWWFAGVEINR